jgi:hypothetical protein
MDVSEEPSASIIKVTPEDRPPNIGEVSVNGCRYNVWRGQRGGSPTVVNLSFLDRSRYFSFNYLLKYPHEAEWTPFQTHYFSVNLVAPRIEPGISGYVARKSDHYTTEAVRG